MLAFPSYNYEGSFKLEQVVELKSAYLFSHKEGRKAPQKAFPPFTFSSIPHLIQQETAFILFFVLRQIKPFHKIV